MSNVGYLFRDIETRSHNDSILNNGEFMSPSDGNFETSTPRKGRSVSYVDVPSLRDEGSPLFDLSWQSQRMRGLSQSICDLKILKEKQMGRRRTSILFEDNLLQEHAKKLKEARMKIKELEAKYSSPQRLRSNLSLPTTGKHREERDFIDSQGVNKDLEKAGCESLGEVGENTVIRSPVVDKIQLSKIVLQRSLNKESSDDRSDIDGDRSISGDYKPATINRKKTKKRRPVTWADDEDHYSSDCNSVSSYGSAWRKLVEIIPEREAHTYTESSRCLGYKGTQKRLDMNDNTSDSDLNLLHRQTILELPPTPPPSHNGSGHNPTNLPTSPDKSKWHSMPNLSTHDNEFNENRKMMYGEAIPVDPYENERKQNTKFGRKSGLYVVNDSAEENQQPLSTNKKQKFRKKFFRKNAESSKKNPSKYITVSAPKEPQLIGRLVGLHPTVKSAYIIELNRLATGSFGLLIQKGYRQYRKGIFVYRITDKKVGKFFGGLVHVGDEVLEVNDTSVQDQNLAFVNKLIKNSDKLQLTILPFLSRKD